MTPPGRSLPSSLTGQAPPRPHFLAELYVEICLAAPGGFLLSPAILKLTFLSHQTTQDSLQGSWTCASFAWASPLELILPDF